MGLLARAAFFILLEGYSNELGKRTQFEAVKQYRGNVSDRLRLYAQPALIRKVLFDAWLDMHVQNCEACKGKYLVLAAGGTEGSER